MKTITLSELFELPGLQYTQDEMSEIIATAAAEIQALRSENNAITVRYAQNRHKLAEYEADEVVILARFKRLEDIKAAQAAEIARLTAENAALREWLIVELRAWNLTNAQIDAHLARKFGITVQP